MNLLEKYAKLTIEHMKFFNVLTRKCIDGADNDDKLAYHAGAIDALLAVLKDVSDCDVFYYGVDVCYYHSIEINGKIYEVHEKISVIREED